ncbi:hypothetical protein JHK86_001447 [Glycine max]|nr:hypothetical protein JHK86_001447 [Glycine max]
MARDKFLDSSVCDLKLKLICDRQTDGRIYNLPKVAEVAALIVGNQQTGEKRDIIVKMDTGKAYCIRLTPAVMLQRGKKVTIREHFAYRMQSRPNEAKTILRSRRLFQQFVVDGYAMIESQRLNYATLNANNVMNLEVACATNAEKSRKIVCARGGGATSRVGGDAIQVENKRYRCDSREVSVPRPARRNDYHEMELLRPRVKHPDWLIHGLREVVMECNMVDIPMVGYPLHGPREEIKAWRRFVRNRSREDISLSKSKLEDLRCSDDEKRV